MPFKMKSSPFNNLRRWFEEDWRTPSGKKVSKETPKTWSEVTPESKAKAQREKNTKGRVTKY
jgi:hypothetical protein